MPLSQSENDALQAAIAAEDQAHAVVVGLVAALVPDADPHPLQVALDAMTAERDALQAKLDAKSAALDALDAADAAADIAEAAEDTARAAVRNAGE